MRGSGRFGNMVVLVDETISDRKVLEARVGEGGALSKACSRNLRSEVLWGFVRVLERRKENDGGVDV